MNEPVFYHGQVCGTVRKYSDTLLIFLLKGARPDKFRDNATIRHTGPTGGAIQIEPGPGLAGGRRRRCAFGVDRNDAPVAHQQTLHVPRRRTAAVDQTQAA